MVVVTFGPDFMIKGMVKKRNAKPDESGKVLRT